MIRFRDTILEDYFIDPVTAVITNSKGEIQRTYIKGGRPYFKKYPIHHWQVHTHIGYKKEFDIHHIDENKLNNSLENLVYLTHSEHTKIHNKGNKNMFGKHHSEETKIKISEVIKGERNGMFGKTPWNKGKTLSEETKLKIRETSKGRNKDRIWINNGVISKMLKCDEEIPEGFVRGRLKNK